MDELPASGFATEWATTPDDWAELRRHRYRILVEDAGHYEDTADHDRRELAFPADGPFTHPSMPFDASEM